MIVWVARRLSELGLADRVVVATDAPEIQVAIARELVGFIWAVGQALAAPNGSAAKPEAGASGKPRVYVMRADKNATTESQAAQTMAKLA